MLDRRWKDNRKRESSGSCIPGFGRERHPHGALESSLRKGCFKTSEQAELHGEASRGPSSTLTISAW